MVVVRGGTLVDGTGRAPLPDATIVVRDGRVTEVIGGGVGTLPTDAESIDARGKWIVPGLIDMHVHYQPGWMDALFLRHGVTTVRESATSADRRVGAARRLGCLKQFVTRLQRAGGHVVTGSDTSNPYVVPGASLARELELLVEAGLSPREALAAATRTAAAFLGQTQSLGTLEVGKTADLVVLGADPSASITAVRQVEVVIRDGRFVWRR